MKKEISIIACFAVMFSLLLCGCGQSNSVAQERQAAEREASGTSIQMTGSATRVQTEKGEEDKLYPNESTSTLAAINERSDMQESAKKESIVWVKDTEIERNMKTGEIITWQHEVKLNRDGHIEEDYSTDSDSNIKILLYRYDNNGNCTWECQVDSSGYVNGQLREYDENNHVVIETRSGYMDEEDWLSLDQAFEQEILDSDEEIDPELLDAFRSRIALYKKYTVVDTFTIDGVSEKIYFFPMWIYQYEYDSSGRYLQAHRLESNPEGDYLILYDYEDTPDGYKRIQYVYRNGELSHRTIFYFDKYDREQEWEAVTLSGKQDQWRTTKYDSDGNVIEKISYTPWDGTTKTQYMYDINGNVVSEKSYDYSWNEDIPYETHEYTYKSVVIQG